MNHDTQGGAVHEGWGAGTVQMEDRACCPHRAYNPAGMRRPTQDRAGGDDNTARHAEHAAGAERGDSGVAGCWEQGRANGFWEEGGF